jgi:hypothetical protein
LNSPREVESLSQGVNSTVRRLGCEHASGLADC